MTKKKKNKIAKKRSFKKFLQTIYFWTKLLLIILIFSAFILEPIKNRILDQLYSYSIKLGLSLDSVIIDGVVNSNINSEYILNITGKKKIPILSLDIQKIQNIISANSWVKGSYAFISLPSTLKIIIEEKKPLAIWQNNGKVAIIDQEGNIITHIITSQYQFLPLIVGKDGNINAQKLINELSKSNELMNLITASIYVGSRRWDLIINEELTVQMPEINFSKAYKYLTDLHKKGELANLKKLDLRDEQRYYKKQTFEKPS
jgi:cell division protein FtsQ